MIEEVDNETVVDKTTKTRGRDKKSPAVMLPSSKSEGDLQLLHQVAQSPTAAKRSSKYRGVSRHRWTGRYEAHLWDKGSWNPTQRKKGKQASTVYLGAYDEEESAARAYDLAAIKYWGPANFTNFPASDYEKEIELMKNITREEYLVSLRRRSSGFSRGVSKYRGVARHHHNGRWEARIGRVFGNKYLYLGTYSTQEEAAHAYDTAAIEYRGVNAVTNFDLSTYIRWLRPGKPNSTISQDSSSNNIEQKALLPFNQFQDKQTIMSSLNPIVPYKPEDFSSPRGQPDYTRSNTTSSHLCNNSSSPTALGLLFRSSVFQELVQRNSTTDEEESTEELQITTTHRRGNENDELARILFEGAGGNLNSKLLYSFNNSTHNTLPNMTPAGNPSISLYNQTTQSLWKSAL